MKKGELLIKSRESMMAAVQAYNNPQITFKTETFITLAIIAWTYLLHAYYANAGIDYRYYEKRGKRKFYEHTKNGAVKHWELERCLNSKKSPIDKDTKNNLMFLIGLRHEIEHQMTRRIDDSVSAKIQACAINYNYYLKKLFGDKYGVDDDFSIAIQFSPIVVEQKNALFKNEKLKGNIASFIARFENKLSEDEYNNPQYAYRVVFSRIDGKRINSQTDEVIEFVPITSEKAKDLNRRNELIKETEKKKYLGGEIVEMMKQEGYDWFSITWNTHIWKEVLGTRDGYGLYITRHQWMWYENWIPVVRDFCKKHNAN